MAHEITSKDGMVLYREPSWTGLGIVVKNAPSPAEALQLAGLDWDVEQIPLTGKRTVALVGPDGTLSTQTEEIGVASHVANYRMDTHEILGVVGSGYTVVQNRDIVGLIIEAAQNEGVTVESAGSLRAGRDVFILAHLNTFLIGEQDKVHSYALFANSHDGSHPLLALPTNVRVVCANTKAAALQTDLKVVLRHTSGIRERMDEVRACLRGAAAYAKHEEEKARSLASRRMGAEEISQFFAKVYERLYGEADLDPKTRGAKSKATRAIDMVGDWAGTLARESAELGDEPSAWLVANAVTNWIDHRRTIRGGDRLHSNLFGSAAAAKEKVFAEALTLVG